MDFLSKLLGSFTSSSAVDSMSEKTGASSDQISKLIGSALPMLMKAVTKNASTEEGASSLAKALSQHSTNEDVTSLIKNVDMEDGKKIIGHILGDNQASEVSGLASETGMSTDQVSSIMSSFAPALLSGLSSATAENKKSQGFDLSDGFDMNDIMGLISKFK